MEQNASDQQSALWSPIFVFCGFNKEKLIDSPTVFVKFLVALHCLVQSMKQRLVFLIQISKHNYQNQIKPQADYWLLGSTIQMK